MINNTNTSHFSLFQLDTSLLAAHYQAKAGIMTSASSIGRLPSTITSPPTVSTPWDNVDDEGVVKDRDLEKRVNTLKGLKNFIDEKSSAAKLAGNNKDAKALFTLYEALVKLKDIADYAAGKNRTDTVRSTLDILTQNGLKQINSHLQSAETDLVNLVYGTKSYRVETAIGVGRNSTKFVGRGMIASSPTAALSGITASDKFTVTVSKSGEAMDFDIDLSEIDGPISLQSIADLANSKLSSIKIVDGNGDEHSRYTTRFNVENLGGGKYALALSGLTGEIVTLTAAVEEPSLIVVGNSQTSQSATATGTLTKLDNLDSADPTRAYRDVVAGEGVTPLEVKEEKESDLLNGRTNAVVEKLRKSVSDLYKDLEIDKNKAAANEAKAETSASAVAVDSQGYVYVVGATAGDLGNDLNRSDGSDVFLTKYDVSGNIVWQHLLGASGEASGYGLAIDRDDNIIIAGSVDGSLTGKELFRGTDSFVTKFANNGDQLWVQQIDSYAEDAAFAVTVDTENNIFVTGQVNGSFKSGLVAQGGRDGYVAQLSGDKGTITAATQFGTSGNEAGKAIAIAEDGNLLVASEESGRAILRKIDKNDLETVLWEQDLGGLGTGSISAIAVEGNAIYLAGTTNNASFGGGDITAPQSGSSDGFVTRLDDLGGSTNVNWTNFVGTSSADSITGIAVSGGQVYVSGKTAGTLDGETKTGTSDAFAVKINGTNGSTHWTEQLSGLTGNNGATGLAVASNGSSVLSRLGLGPGTIQVAETRNLATQTTLRAGDHFYLSVNGGHKQKVTIRDGDTFDRLLSRINLTSFRHVKAETIISGDQGRRLKITALNGAEIKIFSGDGDRDALKSLGIAPTTIAAADKKYTATNNLKAMAAGIEIGGLYGLHFEPGLNVASMNGAKYLAGKLADAIAITQRAYRSLYYNEAVEQLKNNAKPTGTVPAYMQKQLANYQNGLNRLLSGS